MDLMLIILCISILMIASGVIYQKLETRSITEPFLALIFGIIVGPEVLNFIPSAEPQTEFQVLKTACEFTIAIALMATALRLPYNIFKKNPVLGILFFRRIPALLVIMPALPEFRKKIHSILLMGWFGPIGVATLYYAIEMEEKAHFKEAWIIPSLIVVTSTVVHGLTSVPLEKLYYRRSTRANEFSAKKDFEE